MFQPRKAAFTTYRGFPVLEFQNFIKRRHRRYPSLVAPFQAAKAGEVVISADPFASVLWLLARKGVMTVDELRRGIEALGSAEYDRLGYYERWINSITQTLLQKGILTTDELGRKLAEIEAREARPS